MALIATVAAATTASARAVATAVTTTAAAGAIATPRVAVTVTTPALAYIWFTILVSKTLRLIYTMAKISLKLVCFKEQKNNT